MTVITVSCICTGAKMRDFVYPLMSFLLRTDSVEEKGFANEHNVDKSKWGPDGDRNGKLWRMQLEGEAGKGMPRWDECDSASWY